MAIEVGDTVPLRVTIRDPTTGLPADATAVVLTITLPDATISTPSVGHTAQGVYDVNFPVTLSGQHSYRWVATGTNAGVFADEFTVEDTYVPFVSMSAQLAHMEAETVITVPAKLERLRDYIRIACEAVELDLGRAISPQTVVQTVDGGCTAIVLNRGPLLSVTSVVDGTLGALAPTDFVADLAAGILYRGTTTAPTNFLSGRQSVVVTTRVGYVRPPAVARKVAMNGAQRMWQSAQMPHPALDDISAELQVQAGQLSPLEYAAYLKLKRAGLA